MMLGAVLVASGATARHAAAACNTIPPASQVYQSDLGSVRQRLAAPGRPIRVVRKDCDRDAFGAKPPFFDRVPTNNVIAITFVPDAATSVPIPPFTSGTPGDCSASDCRTLDFVLPDTDALVGAPNDGVGLAGPARIVVTRSGVTVAHVEKLYEPTDGCDKQPETVFRTFTTLPLPNDVTKLAGGTVSLHMALDGGDNLLVPLDHRAARAGGAPPGLALFERGGADFCAERPALLDPFCWLSPRIDDALAGAPRTRELLQAFTLDGHAIAPLFQRDDKGRLYGTADGDFSVLRIERAPASDPSKKRFDLGYRREDSKGPIVDADFGLTICHAVNLAGLRRTDDLVGHARAASDVHVHQAATAGGDCGVDTRTVAAEVTLSCVSEPCIEAKKALAATIRRSDLTVRVFTEKGKEKTPAASKTASLAPVLNRYPIVVAGGHVYFRAPDDTLALFDPSASTARRRFTDIRKAQRAEIAGRRVIALDAAPPHAVWVHEYGAPAPTSLPVNGSQAAGGNPLANADDVVAVIQTPGDTVTAWPWPPAAGPGPAQATGAVADDLGATQGCGPNGCASRVVLITPEARQQQDLNDDKDQLDRALQLYDASTQKLVSTRYAAAEFVSGNRLVAFRVPEGEQGRDLNQDTDLGDRVMHVVAFDAPAPETFRVLTTGYAAHIDCALQARLGWRDPYVVVEDAVLFLVSEQEQGRDLSGDGQLDDVVLVIFQVRSANAHPVVAVGPIPGVPAGSTPVLPMDLLTAPAGLGLQGSGLAIGDRDRDGTLDPFDHCQTRRNPRQLDDDYDGLGDHTCDPTLCTDFRPPVMRLHATERARMAEAAQPAVAYLKARWVIQRECLRDIALGERRGNATVVCRGMFVEYVENPMLAPHGVMDRAERKLLAALGASASRRGPRARDTLRRARLVVRAYGEAVNAATRAAYGGVVREPAFAGDQADLALATGDHLRALVEAMQECALGSAGGDVEDIGALCLGRIEGGMIVPPADSRTARAIKRANADLDAFLGGLGGPALAPLRSCASRSDERTCFECVNWRNAARAVLSLLGAGVAPTPPTASL